MGHDATAGAAGSSVPLHIETPLIHSLKLSRKAGRPVYLKLENVQPGGSFKIRFVCYCRSCEGLEKLAREAQALAAPHERFGMCMRK